MRKTLEVTGKPLTYATRRMLPGDTFTASDRDARVLVRMKRAREARERAELAPPPAELIAKVTKPDDITALRAEYFEKLGKRPFYGWDVDTLRSKIAEG